MASAHVTVLAQNLSTGNAVELLNEDGTPITNPDLSLPQNEGYSKAFLLSPKADDLAFTAICFGCIVTISLQMSPDGINWCDCVLSNGSVCSLSCDPAIQDCYSQPIDVAVLQYVRFKITGASTSTGDCTIMVNYTLN